MQRSIQMQRILKEQKEFEINRSDTMFAAPLEGQMHIWHFTIRGPPDTEFQDGIYHGKIELPVDYPLKAPSIYFITPSGRYETNTAICLTITSYHPEAWNPAWTIRSMLQAIVSYFPEKEKVAGVGALSYSTEDRKKIAVQSRKFKCPQCGPIVSLLPGGDKTPQEKENNGDASRKDSGVPEQQQQNSSNNQAEQNQANEDFTIEALSPEQRELLWRNDTSHLVEEVKIDRSRNQPESSHYRESPVEIEEEGEEENKRDTRRPQQSASAKRGKRQTERTQIQEEEDDVPPLIEYILRQHELYYEAKSSIVFRPNILNNTKPPTPLLKHNSARTEDIPAEKQPILQPQNSLVSENSIPGPTPTSQSNEQNPTEPSTIPTATQHNAGPAHQVHPEFDEETVAERQHIQKQIKLIDLLIIVVVVLLICYSAYIRL